MGIVPAPKPLTFKEWKEFNGRDIEFEKWCKYANGFGPIKWLLDYIRGKVL